MSVSCEEFAQRLRNGWSAVKGAKQILTEIDARFGDGDHGVTMEKIAESAAGPLSGHSGNIRELLDQMASAVMMINGGSAVPLWYTFLEGMSEGAPAADSMTEEEMVHMFEAGMNSLESLSKAKVGDKTMMDALIPAVEEMGRTKGTSQEILEKASAAAERGAEATRGFASRFGRARSYGEQTIGTPDAGAVSMKTFFAGLAGKADSDH